MKSCSATRIEKISSNGDFYHVPHAIYYTIVYYTTTILRVVMMHIDGVINHRDNRLIIGYRV